MHCLGQVELVCGLSAEDLKQLTDEKAAHKDIHGGMLGQPWHKVPPMTPRSSDTGRQEQA